jgi:predicted nucleic-acid-binding protein
VIAIDTNVLVRYVADDSAPQSELARRELRALTPVEPGFVSLIVLVELSWVLRRSYGFPAEAIHDLVEELLDAAELEVEDEESVSRSLDRARAGVDFADALIGDAAELYGCTEMITLDRRAADRLGWRLLR